MPALPDPPMDNRPIEYWPVELEGAEPMSTKDSNDRKGDSAGTSKRWTSGHDGENEDKRTGRRAEPRRRSSAQDNKAHGSKWHRK